MNIKNIVTPKARQRHIFGEQKPLNATKFCTLAAVHDVITHAKFGEDRLRVSTWRCVEFWLFPLTCFFSHYHASVSLQNRLHFFFLFTICHCCELKCPS